MGYYDELLDFCHRYKSIYCYGAGNYGMQVLKFLKRNKIIPECFLVSKLSEDVKRNTGTEVQAGTGKESEAEIKETDIKINGIPVHTLDHIKSQADLQSGIILSLHEKHHKSIISHLRQSGFRNIFPVTSDDIDLKIYPELSDDFLLEELMSDKSDAHDSVLELKQKAERLLKQYETVELSYIYMKQIGGMAYWMYYNYLREQDRSSKYYLYYPMSNQTETSNIHHMANDFLMTKLKGTGIEVINARTLCFWQYFVKTYKDRVHISNGYCPRLLSEGINEAVSTGRMDVGGPYIHLSESEICLGERLLKDTGIGDFICIASRDSVYRREVMNYTDKKLDIVDLYRNSEIENFELAARKLKEWKIASVRMGARVGKAVEKDSVIIDYASTMRSDFGDVYLCSACKFLIGDSSGIQVIPKLFARPVITINQAALTTKTDTILPSDEKTDLMILQKYLDPEKKRYLTIREMIEMELESEQEKLDEHRPAGTCLLYYQKGIKPVKNTPEEIWEIVREMIQRLRGEAVYDELDLQLKDKYDAIKKEYMQQGVYFFNMRIGREFLRNNQWMLDDRAGSEIKKSNRK